MPSKTKAKISNTPEAAVQAPANHLAELALPVYKHMHLNDIQLLHISAIRQPSYDKYLPNPELQIVSSEKLDVAYNEESKIAASVVTVGIQAQHGEQLLVEINAIYRVIYSVKDSFSGDKAKERSEAFCKINSLAHAWPYWRELLVSTCLKMGIPPILAPILLAGTKIPE